MIRQYSRRRKPQETQEETQSDTRSPTQQGPARVEFDDDDDEKGGGSKRSRIDKLEAIVIYGPLGPGMAAIVSELRSKPGCPQDTDFLEAVASDILSWRSQKKGNKKKLEKKAASKIAPAPLVPNPPPAPTLESLPNAHAVLTSQASQASTSE
ncbi:hypothetical protein PAPYR_9983 [Paratrimastix pyriformis]|uniref:Uncharacterized protein n=1 Tax=Paratrimastix pyriformis TaxID=342808 RepID=A0ABQ8U321_9EUKA|nr:hypothetical protein PAPYR_11804 [Paratrimastix pyriformis]KAJ4455135.1 hypothetical protein PAPYR_9983 [Paratrimastix pyriformis]